MLAEAASAFGAPDMDARALVSQMHALAPRWLEGCRLRPCWFEPTFQKHAGKLCAGFQIHVDDGAYVHGEFQPWRLVAGAFKCIRRLRGEYPLWRDFHYEYEKSRLAIDLINGSVGESSDAVPGDDTKRVAPHSISASPRSGICSRKKCSSGPGSMLTPPP